MSRGMALAPFGVDTHNSNRWHVGVKDFRFVKAMIRMPEANTLVTLEFPGHGE